MENATTSDLEVARLWLSAVLGIHPEVLDAIASGELSVAGLLVEGVIGGAEFVTTPGHLAGWRRENREVEMYGREAVREAQYGHHSRDRQTRAQAAKSKPMRYWLYRLFGADDRLLYVGITRNLPGRMKAHQKQWGDVIVRTEDVCFESHQDALDVEASEIAEKCPPFNAAGVGA